MGTISIQVPQIGQPDTTEDVKVQNALNTIVAAINGGLDSTNIAAALAQSASVNQSGQTVKGSSIIATSESRTNIAYGLMPTPDQVTGIVLPANSLITVWYQATWSETVSGASAAAIFLGANQLHSAGSASSTPQAANNGGVASTNSVLFSWNGGLNALAANGYSGDVTTGQTLGNNGGACYIFAAAGTYTVSVQFKASSGTVTALNRRLYVQAVSFA